MFRQRLSDAGRHRRTRLYPCGGSGRRTRGRALWFALNTKGVEAFNLGTGAGFSVLEVIRAFENATGTALPYVFAPAGGAIFPSITQAPKRRKGFWLESGENPKRHVPGRLEMAAKLRGGEMNTNHRGGGCRKIYFHSIPRRVYGLEDHSSKSVLISSANSASVWVLLLFKRLKNGEGEGVRTVLAPLRAHARLRAGAG